MTICFSVALSYFVLNERTSVRAMQACLVVVIGFAIGSKGLFSHRICMFFNRLTAPRVLFCRRSETIDVGSSVWHNVVALCRALFDIRKAKVGFGRQRFVASISVSESFRCSFIQCGYDNAATQQRNRFLILQLQQPISGVFHDAACVLRRTE